MGITLSDYDVFFMPSYISFGIPDNWGAAAVVYALVEGLAGVKDTGVAFDSALLAPRWCAAGVEKVQATVCYPASKGYIAYRYRQVKDTMTVEFTGSARSIDVQLLLPGKSKPKEITLNRNLQKFRLKGIEKSTYACFKVKGVGPHRVVVQL